jgi:hypothetical protein
MIQPTKGISADRALLTIGAQVLRQLNHPATVSAAWHSVKQWRAGAGYPENLPYAWFILALDTLNALGILDYEDGLLVKRSSDASSAS